MPMCKIIAKYENQDGWEPGDIVDITDPELLLKEGKVVLVDEQGNEIERKGTISCPICTYSATSALDLADHIYGKHSVKGAAPLSRLSKEPGSSGEKTYLSVEDIKESKEAMKKMGDIGITEDDINEAASASKRKRIIDLAKEKVNRYIEEIDDKAKKEAAEASGDDLDDMSWKELRQTASDLNIYKVGMKKGEVKKAILEKRRSEGGD